MNQDDSRYKITTSDHHYHITLVAPTNHELWVRTMWHASVSKSYFEKNSVTFWVLTEALIYDFYRSRSVRD